MGRQRHDSELYGRVGRLWQQGQSATEIGKAIGKTRSAVLGIVSRARASGVLLDARIGPSAPARPAAPPKTPRAPKPEKLAPHPLAVTANTRHSMNPLGSTGTLPTPIKPVKPDAMTPTARPWTSRESGECAWPIHADGETYSCCALSGDATYCAEHARLAYAVNQPGKRNLMKLAGLR